MHTPCKLAKANQVEEMHPHLPVKFFHLPWKLFCLLVQAPNTDTWNSQNSFILDKVAKCRSRISSVFKYLTLKKMPKKIAKFCCPEHRNTKEEAVSSFRNSDMPFWLVLSPKKHYLPKKALPEGNTHSCISLFLLALYSLSDCLTPSCKINQYYQILFLQASPWETYQFT